MRLAPVFPGMEILIGVEDDMIPHALAAFSIVQDAINYITQEISFGNSDSLVQCRGHCWRADVFVTLDHFRTWALKLQCREIEAIS